MSMARKNNVTELSSVPIAQAARRCGLTIRAISYYQERGLVQLGRDSRGHRTLSQRSLHRLEFIALARYVGLPMVKIHKLLVMGDDDGEAIRNAAMISECRRRLAEIDHDQSAIQAAIRSLTAGMTPRRSQGDLLSASSS